MADKNTDAVETPVVAAPAPKTDKTPVYDQETGSFK